MARLFLTGNEAMAEAAMASGLQVFIGYPITPASDLFEYLAERLPERGGVVFQAEDEIAAVNALVGAAYAGARAMTATSGPGFSLMAEGIGFAAMVEAPVVIVYNMRAGPSTGIATGVGQGDVMQARWASHGCYGVVVLAPWSVGEAYELVVEAFRAAWRLRAPVIVLGDAVIAHTREPVEPVEAEPPGRKPPREPPGRFQPFRPDPGDLVPPMAFYGEGYAVLAESMAHDYRGYYSTDPRVYGELVSRLEAKIERARPWLASSRSYMAGDAEALIVAFGSLARSALALVRDLRAGGRRVGLWRPRSLWPLDEEGLRLAARHASRVVVMEMNTGQLAREVERLLAREGKRVERVPVLAPELPGPDELLDYASRAGVEL